MHKIRSSSAWQKKTHKNRSITWQKKIKYTHICSTNFFVEYKQTTEQNQILADWLSDWAKIKGSCHYWISPAAWYIIPWPSLGRFWREGVVWRLLALTTPPPPPFTLQGFSNATIKCLCLSRIHERCWRGGCLEREGIEARVRLLLVHTSICMCAHTCGPEIITRHRS